METPAAFWFKQIEKYERDFSAWEDRVKKIVDRYKLDQKHYKNKNSGFNILWSNVQTLLPAAYSTPPNPNISARFDGDLIAKQGSIILERSTSAFVKTDEFNDSMRQVVLDRLLGGRGVAWVRYEAAFNADVIGQISDDVTPVIDKEAVRIEYIAYRDFGHTYARTWQEVRAVWRRVFLDKEQITQRFGEDIAKLLPMDAGGKTSEEKSGCDLQCFYEIWDSRKKKVIWLAKGYDSVVDSKPDPLKLKGFFPCPRPLYATISNDSLIPTPDYVQYQEQAIEMDTLTIRIGLLIKALRVAGLYDRTMEGVQRLLTESTENKLIPVDNWAMFAEKGGMRGMIDWFPLETVVSTLQALYSARDKVKQDIYEITGISDIVRGASVASETATAQRLKGQFATLRLSSLQADVQRFCRDLVDIIADIISGHFDEQTILQLSGVRLLTDEEKAQIESAQAIGASVPQDLMQLLNKPSLNQVFATIKNDAARTYKIDIETDSTIKADQDAEKAARIEFLTAASNWMQQIVQAPAEIKPILISMLKFGLGAFKVGRDLQDEISVFAEQAAAQQQQQQDIQTQEPSPDPVQMREMDIKQQELELKKAEAEAEALLKQRELDLKQQELQIQYAQLENERLRLNVEILKSKQDNYDQNEYQQPMEQEAAYGTNFSERED